MNSHVKEVHLTSAGGKKAKTLKKRESIVKNFEAFLEESNMEPLATLITNLQDLEIGLCNFFQSLHVKDQSNNVKKVTKSGYCSSYEKSFEEHDIATF